MSALLDAPLLDELLRPTILVSGDTVRARRSDPPSSHVAADRSAQTRSAVEGAVIWMLRHLDLTGAELNEDYRLLAADMGWPVVHFDSPRKRAGELVRKGVLRVLNEDDPRGTPAIYHLIGGVS